MENATLVAGITALCALIAALGVVANPIIAKWQDGKAKALDAEIRAAELKAQHEREDDQEKRLFEKTEAVRRRADEVAKLLEASTAASADVARAHGSKLNSIESMVDGAYTAAMRSTLAAKVSLKVVLLRSSTPSEEDRNALAALDLDIADLEATIDEREQAADAASKQVRG